MARRVYKIDITVNDILINEVVIDSHYEEKHSESINDELILDLVNSLDNKKFEPDDINTPYRYFVTDIDCDLNKSYRLIWLLEDHQIYIGVVNAYRRS